MELQDNYTRLYRWIKQRHHLVKNKLPPTIGVLDPDGYDDPIRFLDLSPLEQVELVTWVLNTLVKGKSINTDITSYGIKHLFDKSLNGFYVKNGVMKGAMLIAGFKVNDMQQQNWSFNIRQSSLTNMRHIGYEYPTRYDLEEKYKEGK